MQGTTLPKTVLLLGALGAMVVACGGTRAPLPAASASIGSESTPASEAPASDAVLLRYQPPVGLALRTESRFTVLAGTRTWAVMTGHESTSITRVLDGVVEEYNVPDLLPGSPTPAPGSALAPHFAYHDGRYRAATPSWGTVTRALTPGATFPERAVRVGDRWDDEAPIAANETAVRYHVFYRLVRLEGEGDARHAFIDGIATRTSEHEGVRRTAVYESHSTYDVSTGVMLSFVFHIRTSDPTGFVGGADFELDTRIVQHP